MVTYKGQTGIFAGLIEEGMCKNRPGFWFMQAFVKNLLATGKMNLMIPRTLSEGPYFIIVVANILYLCFCGFHE